MALHMIIGLLVLGALALLVYQWWRKASPRMDDDDDDDVEVRGNGRGQTAATASSAAAPTILNTGTLEIAYSSTDGSSTPVQQHSVQIVIKLISRLILTYFQPSYFHVSTSIIELYISVFVIHLWYRHHPRAD